MQRFARRNPAQQSTLFSLVARWVARLIMPFACARAFAEAGAKSGWHIQYAEFAGAGHGGVWNSDADRAEMVVRDFLKDAKGGSAK